MIAKADLEKLAQVRLDDAVLLFQNGRHSSAYYLAGYAIELSLKACIAQSFQPNIIPDKAFVNAIYTHSLNDLLKTAGLFPEFQNAQQADAQLAAAWGIVSNWTEASRYEMWDPITAATLLTAIQDPQHGVFQWLKKHW